MNIEQTAVENAMPALTPSSLTNEILKQWLEPVEDPELHLSLVGLGLIYHCDYNAETKKVNVEMTLTSPGCPAGDYLIDEVRKRLMEHPLVSDAEVQIVWEPKWDPRAMASEEVKEVLGIW